ncbi:Trm112 family protein [Emticicia sp.]|uniref:Trm112 family protein n=1 Tax=Emticicia sp. TaxID=1930953 RepID=UPI0037537A7B
MTKNFLQKLCCPFDKSDLNIQVFTKKENGDIHEGLMSCPDCKRQYPIVFGVPIMAPEEYRESKSELSFYQKWQSQLNEETKKYLQLE